MGRSKLTITQGDIQRALKAARNAGLDVLHYWVEAGKLVVVVKEDGKERKLDTKHLPTPWSAKRKVK